MNTDIKSPPFQFQLSEGYRAARRINSIFCALALAWSAAQFDLKAISLGFLGNIDLSRASIPLILACAIAYSMVRFVLEFEMQSVEVRRWGYAQTDFKISVYLVRITLLILATSGLSRSVETTIYVILGALGILIVSGLAIFLIMMGLMPLLMYIRTRQGRYSAASRASESMAWAELIVVCALSILSVVMGVASYHSESLRSLWISPPNPFAMGFFVFTCIACIVSVYLQRVWYGKLFADTPDFTEEVQPDGTVHRIYRAGRSPIVWDWYSQPGKDGNS